MATGMLASLVVNILGNDTSLVTAARRAASEMENAAAKILRSTSAIAKGQEEMASAALKAAGVMTSAIGEIETTVTAATAQILSMTAKEADAVLALRQAMLAVDEAIQARIRAEQELDTVVRRTIMADRDALVTDRELEAASLRLQETMLAETAATQNLATAHSKSSAEVVAAAQAQQLAMKKTADVQAWYAAAVQGAMVTEEAAMAKASAAAEAHAAKMDALAKKIGMVGKAAAGALAIIAGYSVKSAATFEASMTLVHTQAGATEENLKDLSNQVLALAPLVGIGPDKLAEGLYHIESAGFRSTTAMEMLKAAAMNAATGMSDMTTSSQAMVGVMAVAFDDVKNAADAAAFLNMTVGIGDMKMQQLSSAIATNVLPTFKVAGLQMKDFGAAIATMTDNVTPANMAATRLRMAVALLEGPTKSAISALKAIGLGASEIDAAFAHSSELKKYGISLSQLSIDLRKPDGLLVAVMDLKSHLKSSGLTASEQGAVIMKAFGGARTSASIQTLLEESDRLESKYKALGTSATRAKAQTEGWAQTQATSKQKFNELGSSLQSLAIQLGDKLLPPITKFVTYLTTHQNAMKAFFGTLIVMLGILTTAWIVEGIAMLAANWPILLIIAAVALLAFGIYELVKHWKTVWKWIKDIAHDVWKWLVDAWHATWKGIMSVVHWIKKEIIDPIGRYLMWIVDTYKSVWHKIEAVGSWIYNNIIKPVVKFFEGMWYGVVAVFNWVVGFFKKWWPLLLMIFSPFIFAILAIWHHFHRAIISAIHTAWAFVMMIFKTAWDGIKALAVAIWHGIYDLIVEPIEKAWKGIVYLWAIVTVAFKTAWDGIKALAVAIWHRIYDLIVEPIEKAWKSLQKGLGKIDKAVRDTFNGILDWMKGQWNKWTKIGEDIVSGIVKGLEDKAGKLWDKVKDIANKMLKTAKDAIGSKSPSTLFADEVGKMIPLGIALGITRTAPAMSDALGSSLTGMVRSAPSMLAGGASIGQAMAAGSAGGAPLLVQINLDGRKVGDALVTSQQRFKGRTNSTYLT